LNCKGVNIRADIGDMALEETFLEQWGDAKVVRRVFVPGEDHSHELEQVEATIARLRRESDAGLLTTDEDERVWLERLKTQTARRDELAAKPYRVAGWVTEETAQTYREVWPDSDHRQLLIDKGIRFVLNSGFPLNIRLYVPEDGQPLPLRIAEA
jgi:site-specific DNA recombinase